VCADGRQLRVSDKLVGDDKVEANIKFWKDMETGTETSNRCLALPVNWRDKI